VKTIEFLERVLPSKGVYFAVVKTQGTMRHEAYTDLRGLELRMLQLGPHMDVYYAAQSYRSEFITEPAVDEKGNRFEKKHYRTHANVLLMRSFWIDVDVGEGDNKYKTREEAIVLGLAPFLKETGLPHPLVVASGGHGLHLYWTLTEDILPGNWQPVADALRGLSAAVGFKIDGPCTSDKSRILRAPGTYNHKTVPATLVEATAIQGAPVDFDKFRKTVEAAAKAWGIDTSQKSLTQKMVEETNVGAGVRMQGPPSDALRIAEKCTQIGLLRTQLGDVPEPLWYAAIQLLHFTKQGDPIVHEWSKGHPEYTPDDTQKKIIQIVQSGVKPTTCAHFEKVNPTGCKGCPHRGNIHSPIALGKHFEDAPPPVVEPVGTPGIPGVEEPVEVPCPPHPFRRVINEELGYAQMVATIESVERVIYPYDIYPVELVRDEDSGLSNGYSVKLRHWQPHDGWQTFELPMKLFAKPSDLLQTLMQNGVIPPAGYDTWVVTMIRAWAQDIQAKKASHRLSTKMGWVESPDGFQVGDRLYTKAGKQRAGISRSYRELAAGFTVKGDLVEWKKLTEFFGRPGAEAHCFAFGSAFGAPLLKLTGYNGVAINLLGNTGGEGKSLTGDLMTSVWREPKGTGTPQDTENYYTAALTFYSNLPYYIDEVTNLSPEALDAAVYGITQGEGKGRMRADSTLRGKGEWQTMLVTSSNASLRQRLSSIRGTTPATQMRLMEFTTKTPEFVREWGEAARIILPGNWGVAGDRYAQVLAQLDHDELRKELLAMEQFLGAWMGCQSNERFWLGALTCNVAGLLLAQATGIIANVGIKNLLLWLRQEMTSARERVHLSTSDGVEAFSQFVNDHSADRLVVQKLPEGAPAVTSASTSNARRMTHAEVVLPRGRIVIHQDLTSREMWVRRKTLKEWCIKANVDFESMIQDLVKSGVAKHATRKVVMGVGTNHSTGVQEPCVIVDLRKVELPEQAT